MGAWGQCDLERLGALRLANEHPRPCAGLGAFEVQGQQVAEPQHRVNADH